jgi:hypothetical protein
MTRPEDKPKTERHPEVGDLMAVSPQERIPTWETKRQIKKYGTF